MVSVIDPVCGMMCDPATSQWKTDYEGRTYHFCSEACLHQFEMTPEKYAGAPAVPASPEDQMLPGAHGGKTKTGRKKK